MTGRGFAGAGSGVHTLRYRQSSLSLAPAWIDASWAHGLENVSACSTPCHGVTGAGGRQRSGPIGGAANGMPRNCRVIPFCDPCTSPSERWISVPCWICRAAIDPDGAAAMMTLASIASAAVDLSPVAIVSPVPFAARVIASPFP